MANRKHITELALGFYSAGIILVHAKDIKKVGQQSPDEAELAEDCHIYLILTRPRLCYVPGSIVIGERETVGKMQYTSKGVPHQFEFRLNGKPNADEVKISEYPHSDLLLIRDGEISLRAPAHLISMMCNYVEEPSVRDFEVQYVGMSYADGKRSARDRLQSHSTLQQVLADLSHDSPESEVLLALVQYEAPQTIMTFDGRDKSLKLEDDRDVVSALRRQEEKITEDLQISLIEAGLIKYFQPPYNDKYKNRFPHPTQKILEEVYDIDFGALTVEINTESINARLRSGSRSVGAHHIASYDLHDVSTRRSFFNIMNVAFGSDASDHSGPIF
ncbi:hypothetical protein [Massilia aerilata]|uniref:Uncharacterized protein n=1 Tax=Massilia aerilata TaxID=453817 RepID=A0ABW0S722_9BURK